ncbi:MAG: hypothetical protein ACRDJG_04010 [Actinomycetota bacterium]
MVGAAFLPRALAGLSLEDFLHEPRRYLTAWATTPTRELVPPALGCLWLAEASGSDQAACEASILLAWLAYDLGDDPRMHQYYRDAAEHARRAGSARLLAYTLLGGRALPTMARRRLGSWSKHRLYFPTVPRLRSGSWPTTWMRSPLLRPGPVLERGKPWHAWSPLDQSGR